MNQINYRVFENVDQLYQHLSKRNRQMSQLQLAHNRYAAMKQYVDENIVDCIWEYVRDNSDVVELVAIYKRITGEEKLEKDVMRKIAKMGKGEKIGVVIGKVVGDTYRIGWSFCNPLDVFDPVQALYIALKRLNGGGKCTRSDLIVGNRHGEPPLAVVPYIGFMKTKMETRLAKLLTNSGVSDANPN